MRNPKGSKECWDPAYLFASRKFLASKYPVLHFFSTGKRKLILGIIADGGIGGGWGWYFN
jgi:hypothetical protein